MLLGGWISMAAKVFRREKVCVEKIWPVDLKIGCINTVVWKKQTIYYCKNLYKLMRIAPKLMNCRVNMTYFVLNHDILFDYFNEENEEQSWKHSISCECEGCNSYFTEQTITQWSINRFRFLKAIAHLIRLLWVKGINI